MTITARALGSETLARRGDGGAAKERETRKDARGATATQQPLPGEDSDVIGWTAREPRQLEPVHSPVAKAATGQYSRAAVTI